MKKYIIIIAILFIIASNVFCQSTFKRFYPAYNIAVDNYSIMSKPYGIGNTFLIAGIMAGNKFQLSKINSAGLIKSYIGFKYINSSFNFKLINNSTIVLTGNAGPFTKYFIKFDTTLSVILESKAYSNISYSYYDRNCFAQTTNNGFIMGSTDNNFISYVLKTDSTGTIEWSKSIQSMSSMITGIIQTTDGGYLVVLNLLYPELGATLIKLDDMGNVIWAKKYFSNKSYFHSILENIDGTVVLTGSIDSTEIFDHSLSPQFLLKLNQNGNFLWCKQFGDSSINFLDLSSLVRQTQDSGYIISATLAYTKSNIILIKTDKNGDTLWTRVHGSNQAYDYSSDIEQCKDKGYLFSGGTNNLMPSFGIYVVKTDSLGHTDSLCEEYNVPLPVNDIIVNDSNILITLSPVTINYGTPDLSGAGNGNWSYDGCHLDAIPELYAEQTAPLIIYPNPSEGRFTVEYKTNIPIKTEIEIYNINGVKVYSGTTDESLTSINLTGNARGLYFIKMSNKRFVKTGKIMIY
jgi:hypothetical protein